MANGVSWALAQIRVPENTLISFSRSKILAKAREARIANPALKGRVTSTGKVV